MCHNKIAFCDDHTGLVVPALGILFRQGAQTRSLGGNGRVVLDVVGREPPFQRSEVAIGKGLGEEFADDGFVALRVVPHVCVLLDHAVSLVLKTGSASDRCATTVGGDDRAAIGGCGVGSPGIIALRILWFTNPSAPKTALSL